MSLYATEIIDNYWGFCLMLYAIEIIDNYWSFWFIFVLIMVILKNIKPFEPWDVSVARKGINKSKTRMLNISNEAIHNGDIHTGHEGFNIMTIEVILNKELLLSCGSLPEWLKN